MVKIKLFFFISITFLILSCAQISMPTGGDKDITPPSILNISPPNYTKNFNSNEITFTFNEYIQVTNFEQNFFSTPLLKKKPEITIKGKKLILKLKEDLLKNTTYIFYFNNAIKDITEGNILKNFTYTFSTGTYLDSLKLKGKVFDAFSLQTEKNFFVFIYDSLYDSIPYKKIPKYIAPVDEKGNFIFQNLAKGKYKIFALKDENRNFIYDLPNEKIAFYDKAIIAGKDSVINLYSFLENNNNKKQYLKNVKFYTYKTIFVFNKKPEKINISVNKKKWWDDIKISNDTVYILHTSLPPFKEILMFSIKDSINNYIDTIICQPYNIKVEEKKIKLKNNIKNGILPYFSPLILKSNFYLSKINKNGFFLLNNNDTIKISNNLKINKNKIIINYKWKENNKYKLIILPKTIINIAGNTNDTLIYEFSTNSKEDYGTISLKILRTKQSNLLLYLKQINNNVIYKYYFNNDTTININHVSPGEYQIKIIYDKNADKEWTTGNYLKKIQAEKVIIPYNKIKIRANWNQELIWNEKK